MCGRFSLHSSPDELARVFALPLVETSRLLGSKPRFNIAPTNYVLAVRLGAEENVREPVLFRWGLVPGWAKDPGIGARMINARAETVAEKPAYRAAFRSRRCLILASGFFEWQKLERRKQPHFFRMRDGAPFAFAGLWENWRGQGDTESIQSCTIITTQPNELVSSVHNRMPVILDRDGCERWLQPLGKAVGAAAALGDLLRPAPREGMTAFPVSTVVNKPGHDTPECIEPIGQQLDA